MMTHDNNNITCNIRTLDKRRQPVPGGSYQIQETPVVNFPKSQPCDFCLGVDKNSAKSVTCNYKYYGYSWTVKMEIPQENEERQLKHTAL